MSIRWWILTALQWSVWAGSLALFVCRHDYYMLPCWFFLGGAGAIGDWQAIRNNAR